MVLLPLGSLELKVVMRVLRFSLFIPTMLAVLIVSNYLFEFIFQWFMLLFDNSEGGAIVPALIMKQGIVVTIGLYIGTLIYPEEKKSKGIIILICSHILFMIVGYFVLTDLWDFFGEFLRNRLMALIILSIIGSLVGYYFAWSIFKERR